MLEHSLYHSLLRIASLTCALVLLFDSGIIAPVTKELSSSAQHYVASVIGVSASIDPNELNVMTAELAKQRQALDAREAALREREINLGLSTGSAQGANAALSTWILSVILFILLVLILLNYVLDHLRRQPITSTRKDQPA